MTPLLYMRTLAYREPYIDYENIGRIIFLRPSEIMPWHSGIPGVYVARASLTVAADSVGYVPPGTSLARAAALGAEVTRGAELRDALGGRLHDEARADALARLDRLNAELEWTERFSEPLRRAFQAADPALRAAARSELARLAIDENDLCAAWHHLSPERRAILKEALPRVDLARVGSSL
jgi:hypothetical protein